MDVASVERFGRLIGVSPAMQRVFRLLRAGAESDVTVLIQGETGTGKELAAEAIHQHSARASSPYVVVDCAAIPSELIESELFGHVRGAFTSAVADRAGAFESADGGTVFIDEIGELPLDLQPRILRVLERRQIKRVGGSSVKTVDVRIIAATHRDLAAEVSAGRFREDLFFRLNVLNVVLPPLRERREDIVAIAEHLLSGSGLELREDARARLAAHSWPGNVRELRNIVERGAAISERFFRVPADLDPKPAQVKKPPPRPAAPPPLAGAITEPLWRGRSFKDAREAVLEDFERGYVAALLREHQGNVSAAARAAGIHRNLLHRMIARYKLGR